MLNPCVVFQEAFGFIERADVVKEIFFHYSEFKGDLEALQAGDDVEFTIKDRNVGVAPPPSGNTPYPLMKWQNVCLYSFLTVCSFVPQGKEVATEVRLLPQGTVIFEDISIEQFEGTVVKVIPKVPTKNQASGSSLAS